VLFLFVIMLLGAERLPPRNVLPWQRPLAFTLAAVLVVESIYVILSRAGMAGLITTPAENVNSMEYLRLMALDLFGTYLLPFEVTSVLLLVAMVGAIVLTKQERKGRQS